MVQPQVFMTLVAAQSAQQATTVHSWVKQLWIQSITSVTKDTTVRVAPTDQSPLMTQQAIDAQQVVTAQQAQAHPKIAPRVSMVPTSVPMIKVSASIASLAFTAWVRIRQMPLVSARRATTALVRQLALMTTTQPHPSTELMESTLVSQILVTTLLLVLPSRLSAQEALTQVILVVKVALVARLDSSVTPSESRKMKDSRLTSVHLVTTVSHTTTGCSNQRPLIIPVPTLAAGSIIRPRPAHQATTMTRLVAPVSMTVIRAQLATPARSTAQLVNR